MMFTLFSIMYVICCYTLDKSYFLHHADISISMCCLRLFVIVNIHASFVHIIVIVYNACTYNKNIAVFNPGGLAKGVKIEHVTNEWGQRVVWARKVWLKLGVREHAPLGKWIL